MSGGEEGEALGLPRERQQRSPFLGKMEPVCETPEHSSSGNSPPRGHPRVGGTGQWCDRADVASEGRRQPDPGPLLPRVSGGPAQGSSRLGDRCTAPAWLPAGLLVVKPAWNVARYKTQATATSIVPGPYKALPMETLQGFTLSRNVCKASNRG